MFKLDYSRRVYEAVEAKNPGQPEFLQAVHEVITSLEPVIEANPAYEKNGILERIVEPERQIMFRVSWVDDNGKVQVNRGYRIQFNSAIGPYKGGLSSSASSRFSRTALQVCPWAAARAVPISTPRASLTERLCASARAS